MATLTEVVRQLEESNKKSEKRHDEIKVEIKKGITDVAKSISGIKSAGLRVPGLQTLTKAIIDNPITRAIGSFKDAVINSISAPFRMVGNAVSTIKNSVLGLVTGVSKVFKDIITAPLSAAFGLIKSIFSTNFEKENNILLDKILTQMLFLNNQMNSYFDYLKTQQLDNLKQASDDTSIQSGPTETQSPEAPQKKLSIFGIGGLLGSIPKLLGGLALAITAEFLGLDKFIKALFVGDGWKSLKAIPTRIVNTFKTAFKSIDAAISGGFTKAFQGVLKTVRNLSAGLIMFTKTLDFTRIAAFFEPVTNAVKRIGNMASKLLTPFKSIGSGIGKVGSVIGSGLSAIGKFFGTIGKILAPIGNILKPILSAAKLFARFSFLLPLITLFDFVKGAFKGFNETSGGIVSKLLGALEGGIKGIITGILEGVDVLIDAITFFPRKILELFGADKLAQQIKDFSLADMFNNLYDGVKNFFMNFSSNIGILASSIGGFIKFGISSIGNKIANMFDTVATTFMNLKDKFIIAISKIGFSLPTISVPLPKLLGGGEFTLLKGTRVGFGSASSAEAARGRIEQRNAQLIERKAERSAETNAILENAQRQLSNTVDNRNNTSVQQNNAVDARSTQNNNTTVLNQAPVPSTYDGFDKMAPI